MNLNDPHSVLSLILNAGPVVKAIIAMLLFASLASWSIIFRKKRLLRLALRRRLPAEHFRAPKRGFVGPTGAWLRHELKPMLQDELSAGRLKRLGYFDTAMVDRLLGEHMDHRHNREGILWALLCFSLWHRTYAEGPAPRPGVPTSATAPGPASPL